VSCGRRPKVIPKHQAEFWNLEITVMALYWKTCPTTDIKPSTPIYYEQNANRATIFFRQNSAPEAGNVYKRREGTAAGLTPVKPKL
jgi:hypothetical protein